jgi:hypothetical protein
MKAAEKGHEKIVDALINLDAQLNLQNSVSLDFDLNEACHSDLIYNITLECIREFTIDSLSTTQLSSNCSEYSCLFKPPQFVSLRTMINNKMNLHHCSIIILMTII